MCAIQITRYYWLAILLFLTVLHLVRSQDTETVTTIDDSNPAITYSKGWESFPKEGSFNGSAKLSTFAGSSATFKFNGTRVSVFGLQQGTGGNETISTYSVDNSSPSQYSVPLDLHITEFGVKFYSSPLLSEGSEHTLFIKNMKDRGFYWLDYIQVSSPVGAVPPTSTSSDNKTSDPTPTLTAGNTQQSKAGISKGAIAGIALGISALIMLLLLAALLWKRRHPKSTKVDSTADLPRPLEEGVMRGGARLEPYQVEQFAPLSNVPPSGNGFNEKRTYNGVAPSSTESNASASHSLANGHASDSATSRYTSEWRDSTSKIPRREPSSSRPMSLSKLRPPYGGDPSSRSTGNTPSAPVPQMPPSIPISSSPSQKPSSNGRRSTDGGVRIAGGPPRTTRGEELGEINDTPTLPPAYRTY